MNKYNTTELIDGVESLKLNYSARLLLIKLIHLKNENNSVTISQADLMKLTNTARPTITRSLKALRENEFVTSENNGNRGVRGRANSTYTVKPHFIAKAIDDIKQFMKLDSNFEVA